MTTGLKYPALPRDFEQTPPLEIAERTSKNRWSPRRNRWKEVAEFDRRAAELEQRLTEVDAELREVHERRVNAPSTDAARLADWELADRKGSRPEPEVDALDKAIQARQKDRDGLLVAIDRTLAEKAAYVSKHRPRLEGSSPPCGGGP